MPEKFESILRNIVPLILIIAVSWFFSFLASKAKKHTDQPDAVQKHEENKGFGDVYREEEDVRPSGTPEDVRSPAPSPSLASDVRMWQSQPVGPKVTSKPINPKWWGA